MCHQSVGLIQAALEVAGVATVGVSLCQEITQRTRSPRSLYVPFPFGYPLGKPLDPELQREIVMQALELLEAPGPPPVEADYS